VSDRSARPAAKPEASARRSSDDEGEEGDAGARYAQAEARYARTPRKVEKQKGKASDRRSVYDVTFGNDDA
jgi:hypothetical protein